MKEKAIAAFRWTEARLNESAPARWLFSALPVLWFVTFLGRQVSWGEFWLWVWALWPLHWVLARVRSASSDGHWHPERLGWALVITVAFTALVSGDWPWAARGAWIVALAGSVFVHAKFSSSVWWQRFLRGVAYLVPAAFVALPLAGDNALVPAALWGLGITAVIWLALSLWISSSSIRLPWLAFVITAIACLIAGWYWFALAVLPFVLACYAYGRLPASWKPFLAQGLAALSGIVAIGATLFLVARQPDWSHWYYGGYFLATAIIVGIAAFWAHWQWIRANYVLPPR